MVLRVDDLQSDESFASASFASSAGVAIPRVTDQTWLKPCSLNVGESGRKRERDGAITPSILNWPAFTSWATSLTFAPSTWMWPPSAWVLASAVLLEWMTVNLVPVSAAIARIAI